MPAFSAADSTQLTYRVLGDGAPLVCLPGGPMRDSRYFGDLGGLAGHRQGILLDLRGTGLSAVPADPDSYRCDRLVADVEALREHLGLDTMDLLGHSAGGNLAVLYATRYPERVARLLLITPSTRAVGLTAPPEARQDMLERRQDHPLHEQVRAAYERIAAGQGTDADWEATDPFAYGRWDEAAQAHAGAMEEQVNWGAADVFAADGAFEPELTRAALAGFRAPVLLLAGELDLVTSPLMATEYAALFPDARLVVQPGAGHYPWLDDAAWFTAAVTGFLAETT
jgi:proline iminopeptidase